MAQVWVAVITASAALLGVLITATVNHFAQRATGANVLKLEQMRSSNERHQDAVAERMAALSEIHVALSRVQREFSQSRLVALLDAGTLLPEYDKIYVAECERFDRSRLLVALHATDLQSQAEDVYAQMNIFWGGTRGAIIDQAAGTAMEQSGSFESACAAARALSSLCSVVKDAVVERGKSLVRAT